MRGARRKDIRRAQAKEAAGMIDVVIEDMCKMPFKARFVISWRILTKWYVREKDRMGRQNEHRLQLLRDAIAKYGAEVGK